MKFRGPLGLTSRRMWITQNQSEGRASWVPQNVRSLPAAISTSCVIKYMKGGFSSHDGFATATAG